MKTNNKYRILNVVGMMFCTVPAIVCTLQYFPIWVAQGGETIISGSAVIMLILSVIPFHKQIKAYLKSPSAWSMWMILFVAFFLMQRIIDACVAISFVACIGNIIGALIFKWRDKCKEEVTTYG